MTIVAVSDNPEGAAAVRAAIDEARGLRDEHVVAVSTGHTPLDVGGLAGDLTIELVFRTAATTTRRTRCSGRSPSMTPRLLVMVSGAGRPSEALLGSLSQKLLHRDGASAHGEGSRASR